MMVCKSVAIATAALSRSVAIEVKIIASWRSLICDFTDAVSDLLVIHHRHVAGLPYNAPLCARVWQIVLSIEIASVERGTYC